MTLEERLIIENEEDFFPHLIKLLNTSEVGKSQIIHLPFTRDYTLYGSVISNHFASQGYVSIIRIERTTDSIPAVVELTVNSEDGHPYLNLTFKDDLTSEGIDYSGQTI